MQSAFNEIAAVDGERARQGAPYHEFLRAPTLSAGIYVLPAGTVDGQVPHKEDELYYVLRGRARMRVGVEERRIGPGSVIFVSSEVQHRFHDIEEELAVLVVFAPAESE